MTVQTALLRRSGTLRDGRTFLIRPMRSDDAEAVVALRDSVAAEGEFIAARPGERSVTEEMLSLTGLLSEGGLSLVAEVDDHVAAHLVVQRRTGDAADTADLAIIVINTCRGGGLGRELMQTAVDWCRAVRLRTLRLCVYARNERAIALYRAVGFVDAGTARADAALADGDRRILLMRLDLR